MSSYGPKAIGCLIGWDDLGRICASLSIYGAQVGCGSIVSALGIAFSLQLNDTHISIESRAARFAFAGIGYFCGICISAKLISAEKFEWSKTVLTCIFISISAWSAFAMVVITSIPILNYLYFIQFLGVGAVDNFSTLALAEMWGQRVQPWMQAKSGLFALAAVFPALSMTSCGVTRTYFLIGLLSMSCFIGLIGEFLYVRWITFDRIPNGYGRSVDSPQSSPVSILEERRHLLEMHRNESIDSSDLDNVVMDDALLSTELFTLEVALDNGSGGTNSRAMDMHPEEVVPSILNATEYCAVSRGDREDPSYEPTINRTLAYATSRILKSAQRFPTGASIHVLPPSARHLLAGLLFLHGSLASTVTCWIPAYLVLISVPQMPVRLAMGVYFFCGALGCAVSVPLSLNTSTSCLLRIYLLFILASALLLAIWGMDSAAALCIGIGLLGFGISTTVSLTLSIANDYGYTMDAQSAVLGRLGGAGGMACVPYLITSAVISYGPGAVLTCIYLMSVLLVGAYTIVHNFFYVNRVVSLYNSPLSMIDSNTYASGNSYQYANTLLKQALHPPNYLPSRRAYSSTDSGTEIGGWHGASDLYPSMYMTNREVM